MIHYTLPPRQTGRGAAAAIGRACELVPNDATVMTANRYLRLRREAAGLTVQQAARRMFGADAEKAELAASLIRALETPGVRARVDLTLDRLSLAFPFDPDVYRQLAHDPAERHPHVCGGCGCSQNDACVSPDGHTSCGWHANSRLGAAICTRCAGEPL